MALKLEKDPFFPDSKQLVLIDEERGAKHCPYQNPLMVTINNSGILQPGQQAQVQVPMYRGCGTWCALFNARFIATGQTEQGLPVFSKDEMQIELGCSTLSSKCKIVTQPTETTLKKV